MTPKETTVVVGYEDPDLMGEAWEKSSNALAPLIDEWMMERKIGGATVAVNATMGALANLLTMSDAFHMPRDTFRELVNVAIERHEAWLAKQQQKNN